MSVLVNSSPSHPSFFRPLPNRLISLAGNETKPNPARWSIKTSSCSFGNQPTLLLPIQLHTFFRGGFNLIDHRNQTFVRWTQMQMRAVEGSDGWKPSSDGLRMQRG